jgi:phosphoheptose isomerase
MKNILKKNINNLISSLNALEKKSYLIVDIANIILKFIINKKKIFVFGNGGSFADSSHFVGELTATFTKKRKPLPFILLGSNLAAVTAWSNDYKYEDYIERELIAYSKSGDLLILLSTSGGNLKNKQSMNLVNISKVAKKRGVYTICFLGKKGGYLKNNSNINYIVESSITSTIQEVHKNILHSICEYLDKKIK